MEAATRQTFDCHVCLGRGLEEARNCDGQYPESRTARFALFGQPVTQCPVSTVKPWTREVLQLVSYCESGMGGLAHLPVAGGVLDQAADFFTARAIVLNERHRIEKERKRHKPPRKG